MSDELSIDGRRGMEDEASADLVDEDVAGHDIPLASVLLSSRLRFNGSRTTGRCHCVTAFSAPI